MDELTKLEGAADEVIGIFQRLQTNWYPVTVFPEMTEEDWSSLARWCKARGFPIDRLSGNYGRLLHEPVIKSATEALEKLDLNALIQRLRTAEAERDRARAALCDVMGQFDAHRRDETDGGKGEETNGS